MTLDLQVGKKYVVRDPEMYRLVWARVEVIRKDPDLPYPVLVTQYLGKHSDTGEHIYCTKSYSLDGSCIKNGYSPDDLVAEYKEPSLIIGPEHVGRRVRYRDGSVSLIDYVGIYRTPGRSVSTKKGMHFQDGRLYIDQETEYDIVEILPC